MDAKHTPTPWYLDGALNIKGPQRRPIGTVGSNGPNQVKWNAENEANAAFIVKAVNCHEELVAALKTVKRYFQDEMFEAHTIGQLSDTKRKINEALKKAEAV